MNQQGDEERLDKLISRTINTARPEFEPEEWKQQYPEELEILRSRAAKGASTRPFTMWRVIFGKPITRLAAAAVIIGAVGSFVVQRDRREQEQPQTTDAAKSPAEMLTPISLRNAYLIGGMEAVDEQSRRAFQMLNHKPVKVSVHELHVQIQTDGM